MLTNAARAFGTVRPTFKHPYLPHTAESRAKAMAVIGCNRDEGCDLFMDIPGELRCDSLELGEAMSESQVHAHFEAISNKNMKASEGPFFLGAGLYRHHIPTVVDHVFQRSEFMTAYTPYQPEVSQGTLQALFEYQSLVASLTGCDVSNASMYDGATSTVEAALMAARISRRKNVLMSPSLHPQYSEVVNTYAQASGAIVPTTVDSKGCTDAGFDALIDAVDKKTACVVVQNPDVYGNVHDISALADKCHENKALLVVTVPDMASLGLLASPGSKGADIVVGEGGSLASPMSFGGPQLGCFATKAKYARYT
ncbi:glycine cleavage system P protein [Kipferlia bialata]|uniref:Glycine cleavage system P protein n=1 Tax=Kipferlia bialata TaxID=797122 RepID=A0A9K3GFV0_9EUKA|nr:glycine cleavage system P protein [Kipferlia bialata]|eukprot:g1309.t1